MSSASIRMRRRKQGTAGSSEGHYRRQDGAEIRKLSPAAMSPSGPPRDLGSRLVVGRFAKQNLGLPPSGSVWWAHQDSNLGPMDSRSPGVSPGRGLSHHPRRRSSAVGCGTLKPVIKDARCRAQAPRQSPGSLCTFRRCTAGLAQDCRGRSRPAVSLNSSRSSSASRRKRTIRRSPSRTSSMSPLL